MDVEHNNDQWFNQGFPSLTLAFRPGPWGHRDRTRNNINNINQMNYINHINPLHPSASADRPEALICLLCCFSASDSKLRSA